jgi:hypothetical protein
MKMFSFLWGQTTSRVSLAWLLGMIGNCNLPGYSGICTPSLDVERNPAGSAGVVGQCTGHFALLFDSSNFEGTELNHGFRSLKMIMQCGLFWKVRGLVWNDACSAVWFEPERWAVLVRREMTWLTKILAWCNYGSFFRHLAREWDKKIFYNTLKLDDMSQ